MNYLFYEKVSEDRAKVALIYYVKPESKDMYDGYITVDTLFEADYREGMNAILYVNPQTEEVWYEYEERELAEEEKLEKRLTSTEEMLMQLMLEGGA